MSDHAMIANTFNNYFVDVISVLAKSICLDIPCIALMDGVLSKFTLKQVSNREVDRIISSLKNSTAKDKYGLDTIFFKTQRIIYRTFNSDYQSINNTRNFSHCMEIWSNYSCIIGCAEQKPASAVFTLVS